MKDMSIHTKGTYGMYRKVNFFKKTCHSIVKF